MGWATARAAAFDTESSGVNTFEDRIVTAAIVHHAPGNRPRTLTWLIDPDIPMPTEASNVHGWTDTRIAEALQGHEATYTNPGGITHWFTRADALDSIAGQVAGILSVEAPLIAANAAFDLTLLHAECVRHGVPTVTNRLGGRDMVGVIDPMVLEKAKDPYRKVKGGCRCGCGATDKTLTGLCLHHGVRLTAAHTAEADALAALRLTHKIAAGWPEVARWRLPTLYKHQVEWRREQCDSLRAYFDKAGTAHDGVCGEWPLHVACAPDRVAVAS